MAEVNIYCGPKGRTLTVWCGRPQAEYICEETGDKVILMKDRKGHVIGFERLNYPAKVAQPLRMAFATTPQPARFSMPALSPDEIKIVEGQSK